MALVDSTGIKVANRGEWMRHKWHKRRGYLKIHVAVDIKNKKIISLEVTSEEVHDGKMLKKLIDNASEINNLKGALGDGMYDSNKNFGYLSKKHIKPGIKARSNPKVRQTKDNLAIDSYAGRGKVTTDENAGNLDENTHVFVHKDHYIP